MASTITYAASLYFLESENTVSLSGILHVFHVCEPLTLTEKKKGDGELLPRGSISKGPAGTAAVVHS